MSLTTLLSDPNTNLNVVVELTGKLRSIAGTAVTFKYSFIGIDNSQTAPPYIVSIGSINQQLTGDILFSGLADQSLGSIELYDKSHLGEFNILKDYTFAGGDCVILVGKDTDDYSDYEIYKVCKIDGEPIKDGFTASFRLQSALNTTLSESLQLSNYVGIPHCIKSLTNAGLATAPKIAAYDLLRFTIMVRFRFPVPPSTFNTGIFRKTISGTANWNIRAIASTGVINFINTTGGGTVNVNINSSVNYCDDRWHVAVIAQDDKNVAYLMVDNLVIAEVVPVGSPDLSNNQLEFTASANSQVYYFNDFRIYNRYMDYEEASAIASVRSDGDDINCVGLWRFDDNTGATINDYSSNNNDATMGGVENTAWKWEPSYLGEPQQAGNTIPMVGGIPFNAKADLIDIPRNAYRVSDIDAVTGTQSQNLRSRGTALTITTDYTDESSSGNGSVYKMVSAEDEPVTFDITGGTGSVNYIAQVVNSIITGRSRITSGQIDTARITALDMLFPWDIGYYRNSEGTIADILKDILGSSGLCYYQNHLGQLVIDMLFPPLGPSPYNEPTLDFRGNKNTNYVQFTSVGQYTSGCSVACWVKLLTTDTSAIWTINGAANMPPSVFLITDTGNVADGIQLAYTATGILHFGIVGIGSVEAIGVLEPGVWYFVAGTFSDSANEMKLYAGKQGSSLRLVATTTGVTPPANLSGSTVRIGGSTNGLNDSYPWCAISYAQIWSTVLDITQLGFRMTTPPVGTENSLIFLAKLNEGTGTTVTDSVASLTATIQGTPQWAPVMTVNLDDTPSVTLQDLHAAAPAYKVISRYNRNWHPMSNADIDTGVSKNNRILYTKQYQEVRSVLKSIFDKYKEARDVQLNTVLKEREDAQRLSRYVMLRLSEDRLMGSLVFPGLLSDGGGSLGISRRSLLLKLMDEIKVVSTAHGLSTGKQFRVVGTGHELQNQASNIHLWG